MKSYDLRFHERSKLKCKSLCMKTYFISESSTACLNMHESAWVTWINVMILLCIFCHFSGAWRIHPHTLSDFWVNCCVHHFIAALTPSVFQCVFVSADQVRVASLRGIHLCLDRKLKTGFFFLNWICIQFRAKLKTLGRQTNIYSFSLSDYACMQGTSFWIMKLQQKVFDGPQRLSATGSARYFRQKKTRDWGKSAGWNAFSFQHIWQEFIWSEDNRTPLSASSGRRSPDAHHRSLLWMNGWRRSNSTLCLMRWDKVTDCC